jgi:hypothetical protein
LTTFPYSGQGYNLKFQRLRVSEAENQQARQAWKQMHPRLVSLSFDSKQIIAEKSGYNIHLERPELVIEAIAR